MMRLLVLATVILAFTLVQADEPQKQDDGKKHDQFDNKGLDRNSTLPQSQRCDFIGLSHLSPFVNQNFYFCSKPGWYTLLKNKWYEVIAEVNKDAVTINYIAMFYNKNGRIECVINSAAGPQTCPSNCGIKSIETSQGLAWTHLHFACSFAKLVVKRYPYQCSYQYDLSIIQSKNLFGCSDGLCTKNNPAPCKLDSNDKPCDLIRDIAQCYFDAAVKVAGDAGYSANQAILKSGTQAVENDITLTYDQTNGESLCFLAVSYLNERFNYVKNQETANKRSDALQKCIVAGGQCANELIKREKCPCNGQGLCFRVSDDE